MSKCCFCGEGAKDGFEMAQVFAPARNLFAHWNFKTGHGCHANIDNIHPWTGKKMPRLIVEYGKNYDGFVFEKGCFSKSIERNKNRE